jgi:hypothetical protein
MTLALAGPALALLLGAELSVEAGAPLAPALARLAPGDTLRLGPGEHRGALGRLSEVRVVGAGPGVTVVLAPEGQDGAVATGRVELSGLTLVAGPRRSALKVLGGRALLHRVALVGGAAGAFVDQGRLEGHEVWLGGEYGLLAAHGEVRLVDLTASGGISGLASLHADVTIERGVVTGPSREAGIAIAGGTARLSGIALRRTGPSGLAVSGGEVEASDLTVADTREVDGVMGDCVQVQRAGLILRASELLRCSGAAVEASRARLLLDGVEAAGGQAGGVILTDQTTATLDAVQVTHGGPGLVAMEGASVRGFGTRLRTDPAIWADCAGGTVVDLRGDPAVRRPCVAARPAIPAGDAPRHRPTGQSLDKPRAP